MAKIGGVLVVPILAAFAVLAYAVYHQYQVGAITQETVRKYNEERAPKLTDSLQGNNLDTATAQLENIMQQARRIAGEMVFFNNATTGMKCPAATVATQSVPIIKDFYSWASIHDAAYFPYIYMSYQLPGRAEWGECGCLVVDMQSNALECYWTSNNDDYQYFSDYTMTNMVSSETLDTRQFLYTQEIMKLKPTDANGKWLRPEHWQEEPLLTFSIPTQFDSNNNCIAAISCDVGLTFIRKLVDSARMTKDSLVLLVDTASSTNGDILGQSGLTYPGTYSDSGFRNLTNAPTAAAQELLDLAKAQAGSIRPYPQMSVQVSGWRLTMTTVDNILTFVEGTPMATVPESLPATHLYTTSIPNQQQQNMDALKNKMEGTVREAAKITNGMKFYTDQATTQCWNNTYATQLSTLMEDMYAFTKINDHIPYIYFSYQVNTYEWGDCGCMFDDAGIVKCYYTDSSATLREYRDWRMTNLIDTIPNSDTRNYTYTQEVMKMTPADAGGKWLAPEVYFGDPLIGFGIPVRFDYLNRCTGAIVVDFGINFVNNLLDNSKLAKDSQLVFADTRTSDGYFMALSGMPQFPDLSSENFVYPNLFNAPTTMSQMLVDATRSNNYGQYPFPDMDRLGSDGMLYSTRTIVGAYTVMQATPRDSAAMQPFENRSDTFPTGALPSRVFYNQANTLAQQIGNSVQMAPSITKQMQFLGSAGPTTALCNQAANALQTSSLMKDFYAATRHNIDVPYIYMSYQIPGTQAWGDCGCHWVTDLDVNCYFTARNGSVGTMTYYNQYSMTTPTEVVNNIDFRGYTYIEGIRALTKDDWAGKWIAPELYTPPDGMAKKLQYNLVTYSIPLQFDSAGKCILAVSTDIELGFLQNTLEKYRQNDQTTAVFADTNTASGWFMGAAGLKYPNGTQNSLDTLNAVVTRDPAAQKLINDVKSFSQGWMPYPPTDTIVGDTLYSVRQVGGYTLMLSAPQYSINYVKVGGEKVPYKNMWVAGSTAIAAVAMLLAIIMMCCVCKGDGAKSRAAYDLNAPLE